MREAASILIYARRSRRLPRPDIPWTAVGKKEEPWLDSVRIREDGSLERAKTDDQQSDRDYDWQGIELVRQLLELLVVFIGEALTLRLVRDIWPNAPFKEAATGAGTEERA